MIPPNVILIWGGTNATIPTGWVRETSLDGVFPKAWGTQNPALNGGLNTHSHASTAHGHNLNSHSHDVILNVTSSGSNNATDVNQNCSSHHGHVSGAIAGVSGGSLQSVSLDWSSIDQQPPYLTVIFIKPASGYRAVPNGVMGHWNTATAPSNWAYCTGAGGTPDFRNKYLKGAATGQDADVVTGGGATSHNHILTHGHTANSHTHSDTSGASDTSTGRESNGGDYSWANKVHTHTISLSAATDSVSNYTNTTAGGTDTVEPLYKKLALIKNTSGNTVQPPIGLIGMWLGSLTALPAGWFLCNGQNGTPDLRDYFVKVINTTGELGNTGGSNTHSHSAISHTHISTGTHSHSGSTGGPSATAQRTGQGSVQWADNAHTHTLQSVSSTTAVYANTNIDCSTVDNQPAYLTVAYLQYKYSAGGNVLMLVL